MLPRVLILLHLATLLSASPFWNAVLSLEGQLPINPAVHVTPSHSSAQ